MATPPQSVLKDIPAEDSSSIPKPDVDVLNPFPPVEAIIIDREKLFRALESNGDDQAADTAPERLPNFSFKAQPADLPASSIRQVTNGAPQVKPMAVFLPDDRHVFFDSSYPFSLVGKVRTAVGAGSGTVVGPRHILTASHCVNWTRDATGKIGWMSFTPSYYDGRGPWGEFQVSTTIAYQENGLRMTDEESAWDVAVCILSEPINTKVGGTAGTRVYDGSWNGIAMWQSIGYPRDLFNAQRPEYQSDCVISSNQNFGNAALLGHFNDTFRGQSGGPVWATWNGEPGPRIVGVVSTTPDVPVLGSTAGDNQYAGGRAMNELVAQALRDYP